MCVYRERVGGAEPLLPRVPGKGDRHAIEVLQDELKHLNHATLYTLHTIFHHFFFNLPQVDK